MIWKMDRMGSLIVISSDRKRDMYIQDSQDVLSFLGDAIGPEMEYSAKDVEPGQWDICPDWMESEYSHVMKEIPVEEGKPINWSFVKWIDAPI